MTEMQYNFLDSKFFRLIDLPISSESLKNLFTYLEAQLINTELELIYRDDPEIMEYVIREIIGAELESKIFSGVLTVINCPEDKREDFEWFVKLFAYLESESSNWDLDDLDELYSPGEDQIKVFSDERISLDLDISELNFLIKELQVKFK